MGSNDWLRHRNRGFHVTIRDVDCRDFDVPRFIGDLASMHATFFSFFVGGYVTTYPTVLAYQRQSPYLGGRDLAGEIVEAAHAADIKVLGMIDLGQVTEEAARDHPDWCTQDAEGRLVARVPGLYASCPMGGYQRDYVREILAEILRQYDLDMVKFGGGSFGFARSVCYCPNCRRSFYDLTGHDLPPGPDWADPLWRTYTGWRLDQARRRVVELGDIVHSIDPNKAFMGNSVCFGDPHWTVGAAIDVESQAEVADAVQVEIQTRARYEEATQDLRAAGKASWQYLSWPAETARFMTGVSDTPTWVVASYFLAWPWRRSAMAPAEQKVYLAQVVANGADPMVNLSGGPPAVHEDPRGFDAIRDLYGFLERHQDYYEGDVSGANIAIVYSMETLFFYGQDDPDGRYVREIRGIEQALHEAHIPFDIISTRTLLQRGAEDLRARYRVLVLPNLACLSEDEASILRSYMAGGGSLVATFETSLYDSAGVRREDFLLADCLGTHYSGETCSSVASSEEGYKQVYMSIEHPHPILVGAAGTAVLPMGGPFAVVDVAPDVDVPLRLSAPFIVFPEGFSYPTTPARGEPLAIVREYPGGGRSVHFAGILGALAWTVPYPDLRDLVANAVRWAAHDALPIRVDGPASLQVSLRIQPGRYLVHMVNLTGGERFFRELVPLHDVVVTLLLETEGDIDRAFLLSDGRDIPVARGAEGWQVTVPRLVDYDVLVLTKA